MWVDATFSGVVLLPDESLQLLDLGLALNGKRLIIAEQIRNGGRDELVEDVKFHSKFIKLISLNDAY